MKSLHFAKKFPLLELYTGVGRENGNIDQHRKLLMINIIVLIAIMVLFPMGISAYSSGKTIVGIMDHAFAAALTLLLFYYHETKNYVQVTHIGVFLAAILFSYLFVSKGVNDTGHLWCFTFPLFAFFLLGPQKGLWATLDVTRLLKSSLVMVKEKAMKHRIQLSAHIDGLPEEVSADERKLKQILYNLLSNAAKFTPANGSITLSAQPRAIENGLIMTTDGREVCIPKSDGAPQSKPNTGIQISVSDTGIGLEKEDLEHVFAPFKQVNATAGRKYQGTGLGLSLTRSFVELHGGVIWAESEGENQGSIFSFFIPC